MATYRELVFDVLDDVSGYNITDESLLTADVVGGLLNSIRITLLKQDENQLHASYFQRYTCLEVQCMEDECIVDGITIAGDKIWYIEPPAIVGNMGYPSIKYLGGQDFKSNFYEVDITQLSMVDHFPYGNKRRAFARAGGKIFLSGYSPDDGTKLTLVALFSDPTCVLSCIMTEDFEYPVPSEYKLRILANKHILSMLGIPPDTIDDGSAERPQQQAE